jgi:hypothetical protein
MGQLPPDGTAPIPAYLNETIFPNSAGEFASTGVAGYTRGERERIFHKQSVSPNWVNPIPDGRPGCRTAATRTGAKAGDACRVPGRHRIPERASRSAVRLRKGDQPFPRWLSRPRGTGRGRPCRNRAPGLVRRAYRPQPDVLSLYGRGQGLPGHRGAGPHVLVGVAARRRSTRRPHPRRWWSPARRGPVSRDRVGPGNGPFFFT